MRAASTTQRQVNTNPMAVTCISPKQAMATPPTTGTTAQSLAPLVLFPMQHPIRIATAGTRLLMTWLKFTDTYRSDTLPMAMFMLNTTENSHVRTVPERSRRATSAGSSRTAAKPARGAAPLFLEVYRRRRRK